VLFTDNTGGPALLHWFWEWHEAHPAQHDLGDAPDSSNSWINPLVGIPYPMTAYPWGVPAKYPTVFQAGSPPHGPIHWFPHQGAFLGRNVTVEREADIGPDQDPTNNIMPTLNLANRDLADDGVVNLPLFLPQCTPVTFNYTVTVNQPIDYYVNVWFDWDRDGEWNDDAATPVCSSGSLAFEHAVVNQQINLPVGGPQVVTTPPFTPWHPNTMPLNPGVPIYRQLPIWMRITISEQPFPVGVSVAGGAGPPIGYTLGETEDYYFTPRTICCPDYNDDGIINLYDFAWFTSFWLQGCPPQI